MTFHLVTFASEDMEQSAQLCVESSKRNGVNTHSRFNPGNIGTWKEIKQNAYLFNEKRGCGYWAWKPLIISKEMFWLPDDSTCIYSDAGVEFIAPVSHIIERMDQDIFLFGNNYEHAHWCKRDVIQAIWPWEPDAEFLALAHKSDIDTSLRKSVQAEAQLRPWRRFGKQAQASVIFFKVNDWTRAFVREWLDWCLMSTVQALESKGLSCFQRVMYGDSSYLIDDTPSIFRNHPEFQEHRHDQAILTTMAYREGIRLHYWPATYNDGAFNYEKLPEYAGDDYPILFHHHRRRNIDWDQGRSRFSASAREHTSLAR